VSGAAAIFAKAPHPNAARLWAHFFFSKDGMQIVSDNGYRMFHPDVVLKSNRKKIQELKTVYPDTVAVDKNTEDVKARYAALFGT
jgi:iron(III) transport system substrate-binding protein